MMNKTKKRKEKQVVNNALKIFICLFMCSYIIKYLRDLILSFFFLFEVLLLYKNVSF